MTARTLLGRPGRIGRAMRASVAAIVIAAVAGVGASALGGEDRSGNELLAPSAAGLTATGAVDLGETEEYTSIVPGPCRLLNTRTTTPIIATTRSFDVVGDLIPQGGSSPNCGIPATATSIAINLTGISVGGSTGYVRGWAAGSSPVNATLLNFSPALNASNLVTIPLCKGTECTDAFTLQVFGSAHIVGDVVGYYQAPMYATITDKGAVSVDRSSGVADSEWISAGYYRVDFERPVYLCTPTTADLNVNPIVNVSADVSAEAQMSVFVRTKNAAGAPEDAYFHVAVHC